MKINEYKTEISSMLTVFLIIVTLTNVFGQPDFKYIQIDSTKAKWGDFEDKNEYLRYFGLDASDVNFDGYKDILSGRYIYLNPGNEMERRWKRIDLGINVDGMLFVDVDGDEYADIIGQSLPAIYWFEAINQEGTAWTSMIVDSLPPTEHVNGQGYIIGDLIKGGKPEIMMAAGGGIYYCQIPEKRNMAPDKWNFKLAANTESEESFVIFDIDNDGDNDIVAGDIDENDMPSLLYAYLNPADDSENWDRKLIGRAVTSIDRVKLADMNGDNRPDLIISEERWPGEHPDANLIWYEHPDKPLSTIWEQHFVVTQYSMNNLDVCDIDLDGDNDIITNEHKGKKHKTEGYLNDGKGNFTPVLIDTGKENHLGTQCFDLDGDGDMDIIGQGWDHHQFMHVWRNDQVVRKFSWNHLSTSTGELPPNGLGNQQTSCLVADLDNNGINDFILTDRSVSPSVIWYRRVNNTWEVYVVEEEQLNIEAGAAFDDIDNDGDIDILFGGDFASNQIWWWENPYPNYENNVSWNRYIVKNSGNNKHHDQMFGDFDGDGQKELIFWNQYGNQLCIAQIPENVKKTKAWEYEPIYSYSIDSEMQQTGYQEYPDWKGINEHEGLARADIDGDGLDDIVGGGLWFKYSGEKGFTPQIIDKSYTFSRYAVGQLIEGNRPEVLLVVGDGIAPLYLYQWNEKVDGNGNGTGTGTWNRKMILPEVDNGHTLEVIDFDGDGHLDIFSGEMRFGEGNPDSKIRILLGDGKGNFIVHEVATGFAIHEGKISDLDGDGDFDILAKPYSWNAPRVDIFINVSK